MTTIDSITSWLDETLAVASYHDVSNNGLQIAREGNEVARVALGVDASADFFRRAAEANCQFCVVHHGLSEWRHTTFDGKCVLCSQGGDVP